MKNDYFNVGILECTDIALVAVFYVYSSLNRMYVDYDPKLFWQDRAILVASFKHDEHGKSTLHVDKDLLDQILLKIPDNVPTEVISIAGLARTGKSFLLNIMATYFHHVQQVHIINVHESLYICTQITKLLINNQTLVQSHNNKNSS